jgi:hypothetical protein
MEFVGIFLFRVGHDRVAKWRLKGPGVMGFGGEFHGLIIPVSIGIRPAVPRLLLAAFPAGQGVCFETRQSFRLLISR